jgi:hypothetical protein
MRSQVSIFKRSRMSRLSLHYSLPEKAGNSLNTFLQFGISIESLLQESSNSNPLST